MIQIGLKYISERGYTASGEVEGKLKNVLMGMEVGNLDRLVAAVDAAIDNTDKREKENGSTKRVVEASDF